jgi:hypothetical protein
LKVLFVAVVRRGQTSINTHLSYLYIEMRAMAGCDRIHLESLV